MRRISTRHLDEFVSSLTIMRLSPQSSQSIAPYGLQTCDFWKNRSRDLPAHRPVLSTATVPDAQKRWKASYQAYQRQVRSTYKRKTFNKINVDIDMGDVPVIEHLEPDKGGDGLIGTARTGESVRVGTGFTYDVTYPTVPTKSEQKRGKIYVPAKTLDELDRIPELKDWWGTHWKPEYNYNAFFSRQPLVQDKTNLEILVKRAITEALVVRRYRPEKLTKSWAVGNNDAIAKVLALNIPDIRQGMNEELDGVEAQPELRQQALGIIDDLFSPEETRLVPLREPAQVEERVQAEESKAEILQRRLGASAAKSTEDSPIESTEAPPIGCTDVAAAEDAECLIAESIDAVEDSAEVPTYHLPAVLEPPDTEPDEIAWDTLIQQFRAQGNSWRRIHIRSPPLKFAVAKRVQQLTGHRLHDEELHHTNTIEDLLGRILQPKKPERVFEALELKGELQGLPNVNLYKRRVTPVDRHKTVGRWKVIVKELKERNLPVLGKGKYTRSKEVVWAMGGI